MACHAMIDLETLDTRPEGQILTIGGVKFDPFTDSEPHSPFSYRFDIDEQNILERTISQRTLDEFWANQSEAVIEEAFSPHDRTSCRDVMQALKKWYVGCDRVWSQGEFDIVILENLCRQLGEPIPWAFWTVENCRTILNRMPIDPRKEMKFQAHNALADSKIQAKSLQIAFNHFGFDR